jgi:DNA-binding CsgD family transcriptional regulator
VKLRTADKRRLEKESNKLNSRLQRATNQFLVISNKLEKQNLLILTLQQESENQDNSNIEDVSKELENRKILINEDWEKYIEIFNVLHPNFLDNVLIKYPNLTEGDKRQLIMVKLDYSRAKAALILGISPASVKRAKQRLARKLNLKDITELKDFVERY